MKTSLNALWCGALVLLLSTCFAQTADADSLLWRIEQRGAHVGWLFGTMHVDDPAVIDLPAPVFAAVDEADQFVMEITLDPSAAAGMLGKMYFRDGTELADLLDQDEYTSLMTLLRERGMPEYSAKYLKLWAAYMMVAMPKPTSGQFVDLMLYQRAQGQGDDVRALETIDEQLGLFESLERNLQIELLQSVLEDPDAVEEMMARMKSYYIRNDLSGLEAMSQEQTGQMSPLLERWFEEEMVEKRNRHMTERLIPILDESQDDKTFVAVGALHLPAYHGLVDGLRNAGFSVRPVDIRWD
jgi:hypothetical protein